MNSNIQQPTTESTFCVKRLAPEEAAPFQISWLRNKRRAFQRSYNITNDEQRYQLLHKVLNKELTVSEAAIHYGLKYTTAKNVLNLFLREGRIEKKKRRIKVDFSKESIKEEPQEKKKLWSPSVSPIETSVPQKDGFKEPGLGESFWADRITQHLV